MGRLAAGSKRRCARCGLRPNAFATDSLDVCDVDGDSDLDVWLGQYKNPYDGGQMPTPYYDANDGNPAYLLPTTVRAGSPRH